MFFPGRLNFLRRVQTRTGFLLAASFLFPAALPAQEPGSPIAALASPELAEGKRAFSQGDSEGAYTFFVEAGKANPASPPPGILIAILCSNRGDYEGMHRALFQAANESPLDPEPFFQLADVAIQEKRLIEADLLLERGGEKLEMFQKGRTLPAQEDVRLIYLKNLSDTLTSRLFEERGDLPGAEASIRRLLAREPENAAACRTLGWFLLAQKKLDEAEKAFDRAASLDPSNLPGWLESALLLDERGESAEAKKIVDARFSPDENEEGILLPVIRLYLKWNRLAEAQKIVETLDDRSPERHKLAGRLHLYGGRFSEAENEYQRALLLNPDDFQSRSGYAIALAEQNEAKLRQANDLAHENLKRYPNSSEAAALCGWTELLLGRLDRADILLDPILKSGSFTPTVAYYLAESALAHGDRELAVTLLNLALGQEENFPKRSAAEKLRGELAADAGSEN